MPVPTRALAVLAAALLLPAAASAQPRGSSASGPGDQGLVLGLRLGYGFPSGELAGPGFLGYTLNVDDVVDSKVPIWLELGYRFTPAIWGTAYLELAPASVRGSFCTAGYDCSANDVRLGIELQYHFLPRQQLDPWLGVGFGAEFLNYEVSGPAPTLQVRYSGWEFPLLEGGLDFRVAPRFSIGPYASLSFGQYTGYREKESGVTTSQDVTDETWHRWFQLGVKGSFKL